MKNKELKTLNDFYEEEIENKSQEEILAITFFINKLKAEAVKWVKEFERQKSLIDVEAGEYSTKRMIALESKINTMKNFHNLTSEDLK